MRATEEIKVATSTSNPEMFSLCKKPPYYSHHLISVTERQYKDRLDYEFGTINTAIVMNKFPLYRPNGNTLKLNEWNNEPAYFIQFKLNKKRDYMTRWDVLSSFRNDVGAHFVEDITSRYERLTTNHQSFRLIAFFMHAPSLDGYEADPQKPVRFLNSPVPYLIRGIAAEIQATIYDTIANFKGNKDSHDECHDNSEEVIMDVATGKTSSEWDEISKKLEAFHLEHGVHLRA